MGPLGPCCHHQRAPAVAQVSPRRGPFLGFRRNRGGSQVWVQGAPIAFSSLSSLHLSSRVAQGVRFRGCQEAWGLFADLQPGSALPAPSATHRCARPPPRAAAVLRRCQAPDCHLCHLLSASLQPRVGVWVSPGWGWLLTGPREGEGSALGPTACQWVRGGVWWEGGLEPLSGQFEGVGALEGAPPSPHAPLHFSSFISWPPIQLPHPRARRAASLLELSPLAVATEGLARVPGTTPQRPAWPGQSLGQS